MRTVSLSRPSTRVWGLWLLVGTLTAFWLQLAMVRAYDGNWTSLIGVGRSSALRAPIEEELGTLAYSVPHGYDGRYSFLIAVDPFNHRRIAALFDRPAYRYRRILYSFLAGGGGLFNGPTALAGLVILAALGIGLATAAVGSLSVRLGIGRWVVVGVLANPGVWLTVLLLTPDALALGLALSGVLLWWDRRYTWAIVVLALAALTKETYLLVAFSLAGWTWFRHERKRAIALILGATAPLALWTAWTLATIEHGPFAGGNFALFGVLHASRLWGTIPPTERGFAIVTLVGVVLAAVFATRANSLLRWLTWPWVALGLVTSGWVWNLGNNAARVLAPVWIFAIISLGMWFQHRHTAQPPQRPD
jgi:hypothetical protein